MSRLPALEHAVTDFEGGKGAVDACAGRSAFLIRLPAPQPLTSKPAPEGLIEPERATEVPTWVIES